MICPIVIFPLTLLLPSARVCDDIDVDGNVIVKDEATDNNNGGNMKGKEIAVDLNNVVSTLNEEGEAQSNTNETSSKKVGAAQLGESTTSHGEPIDDFATRNYLTDNNNM